MPTCKMCKQKVEKLVKSHIIPESFFRAVKKESDHLIVISSDVNEREKKSYIGIYDQEILCEICEGLFSSLDDYGQKILIQKRATLIPIRENSQSDIVGWYFPGEIDLNRLELFFISILYRASLSSHPFFEHINLGPYQYKIETMIRDPSQMKPLGTFIRIFDLEKSSFSEHILLDPRPTRIEDVKFYKLYLGSGYIVYIKADKRELPLDFRLPAIGGSSKLHFIAGNLVESSESAIIRKLADATRARNELRS